MDNNIIVDSIKKLCKDKSITVSQLEKEIGLSQGLVSKWMNTTPSLDKIVDIADYFHVSLDEVVGYQREDIFPNMLCDLTNKKSIKWSVVDKGTDENVVNIHGDFQFGYYDEEKYAEKSYFTKYKEGFIIIYVFYEHGKLINPDELSLHIQPSSECLDQAWQDYSTKELKSLWIAILSNMDKVPVEIKAERLKTSFVDEFKKSNNPDDTVKVQKKRRIIYVSNPHDSKLKDGIPIYQYNVLQNPNGCVFYDSKNEIIIDQDEHKSITNIGKDFYIKHKDSLGYIKQARMFDGKILMLISENKIMKLSGFSSGSQHGNVGFDGLLYVLKDAGFDVGDQSKINRDNFILNKQE